MKPSRRLLKKVTKRACKPAKRQKKTINAHPRLRNSGSNLHSSRSPVHGKKSMSIQDLKTQTRNLSNKVSMTLKANNENEYYTYRKIPLNKSTSQVSTKPTKRTMDGGKKSQESFEAPLKIFKTNLNLYNSKYTPLFVEIYYDNGEKDDVHQVINPRLGPVNGKKVTKLAKRISKGKTLKRNINHTLISKNFTQGNLNVTHESSHCLNEENVTGDMEEGPKEFHYSDIKNRKF